MSEDLWGKYLRAKEPGVREKAYAWKTAIGLQDVDHLRVSSFLVKTAIRHIKGEITMDQVREIIDSHYASRRRNRSPRYGEYEYYDPETGERIESLEVHEAQRHLAAAVADSELATQNPQMRQQLVSDVPDAMP